MRAILLTIAAALAAPRLAHAQPMSLTNFPDAGARVCFFEEGSGLFRACRIASRRNLLPDVSMLAGHGGPGCSMATVPGQGFSAAQRAEVIGDYVWRAQTAGQRYGVQFSCYSGVRSPSSASTAEICAARIATPIRGSTPLCNTQIGFTGRLFGAPQGSTLAMFQRGAVLDNPLGVIAYQGYPARAGALGTEACVEARYIADGRPLLQALSQQGRSCTMVAEMPTGAMEMGAAGGGATGLGLAGRVCGNVVFIAGTEVLMYQAEEFSRYADELDRASLRCEGVPFNADACQPWCGDYWQQAGWYYGVCGEPPADPKWAGSPGLRYGSPDYDQVLGQRIRDSFGARSHVSRCYQAGLDPAPGGFVEVPTWRVVRQQRDPRQIFLSTGPDCFRLYDEFVVPDVERIPYYLPRGARARLAPECGEGRGGRIGNPGGVDPPFDGDGGGGCAAASGGGAGAMFAIGALLLARKKR